MTPGDSIFDAAYAHMREVASRREAACELALQTGGAGVLETWGADGSVSFEVTGRVPYGQIHVRRLWGGDPTGEK